MSFAVRFFIESAMRTFSRIATTGGISQIGLNTKALIESEPARSTRKRMRVTAFVAMERFSSQRRRRFGWSGWPLVSPRWPGHMSSMAP